MDCRVARPGIRRRRRWAACSSGRVRGRGLFEQIGVLFLGGRLEKLRPIVIPGVDEHHIPGSHTVQIVHASI